MTGDDENHTGPQPYEGFLSDVCEMFGCTPDVAEQMDPILVRRIGEYRAARAAVQLFRGGNQGAETLAKNPELLTLLQRMTQAQTGVAVTGRGILDSAAQRTED